MTTLSIKIIDEKGEIVEVEDLTSTGAEILMSECKQLLSDLEDKFRED